MTAKSLQRSMGVLFSGGLDSSILVGHLLASGWQVQPIYVACGLVWQEAELAGARAFLECLQQPRLRPLVVLEQPLADLYGDHWSMTGRAVPDDSTPDEAVHLPGRNPLLIVKARLWCQLHGVDQLALGSLVCNPFADATDDFFRAFEAVLDQAMSGSVALVRPFAHLSKRAVLALGAGLPLELTFSCLAPREGRHCGRCNKCAERASVFADAGAANGRPMVDPHPQRRRLQCSE